MNCQDCQEDKAVRSSRLRSGEKLRSYQVLGATEIGSMWEWEQGICSNQSRCWGPNPRYWTVLKSETDEFVFRHHIGDLDEPRRRSLVDELR